MQKLNVIFLSILFFGDHFTFAQENPAVTDYINTYREIAISEMKRTGVPAAIKLAQGIHETEAGTSKLVKKSNNHFGIKCKTDWSGMTVRHTDDAPKECFRKYESSLDSYKDHSDFLRKSSRYASLFALDPLDYSGWAYGLKKAGYATNPKYPQIIIKLIEDYHLQDYTLIALGKSIQSDDLLVKQEKAKTGIETSDSIPVITFNEKPVVMPPEPEIIIQVKRSSKKETKSEPANNSMEGNIEKQTFPEGVFLINETKVIYAKRGTSYLTIAEKFNVPLSRLFEFNDSKEQEFSDRDQLIYLMRKRKTGFRDHHIVKEGETLNDIAQAEAIRIESLLEFNFLQPGMKPAVGAVLYLKSKAPAMPALATGN